MDCLYRRDFDADRLLLDYPLEVTHPNKKLVFELALSGERATGTIGVTRWNAAPLPTTLGDTEFIAMPGYFDYAAGSGANVWHLNFADPHLFFAYGSGLLAQDELQCAEHPALGAVREALIADHHPALTEQDGIATPVLVANVERRCTITGLYGNQFPRADEARIRAAVTVHSKPNRSNIIAIAAPVGTGRYTQDQITYALSAAYTGFAAAVEESNGPVEIRTGFWGCGAFGGNRELMTMIQLFAARLAGIARLRFYAFDDAGRADYERGLAAMRTTELAGIADRGYVWGVSNGT